jgi:hypothetical protein
VTTLVTVAVDGDRWAGRAGARDRPASAVAEKAKTNRSKGVNFRMGHLLTY